MQRKHITAGVSVLMVCSLFLAACSGAQATTVTSTVDANAIYTQAAQTVDASIQMTEAARPSATPTATAEPTNTLDPTVAEALTSTANAVLNPPANTQTPEPNATETTPDATQATATLQITPLIQLTPTTSGGAAAPAPSSDDKAQWISSLPDDGVVVQKEASWDQTITFKNTGTSTWTTGYALKYWGGDRMDSPIDFYIQREVKPGESYSFIFPMKAPNTAGEKNVMWALQNDEGYNFAWVSLQVIVAE